ncbi:ferritin-like domain-containing protein [Streptomyces sp. NPDC060035]|uniref:ferritin-like domain-containing protein n=1 Tax=Streptomyces sp. NPDC060035 TaxID=3347044 RepID=UPI0036CFE96E
MTTPLDYESNKIVILIDESAEERNAQWLKGSFQQAVLLELATIPPYLCGLWSI